MTYLVTQMILWLLLAFLVGFLLAWWFRGFGAKRTLEENTAAWTRKHRDAEERNAHTAAELNQHRAQVTELEEAVAATTSSLKQTQRELDDHKTTGADLEARLTAASAERDGYKAEGSRFQTELVDRENRLQNLESDLASTTRARDIAESTVAEKERKLSNLETLLASVKSDLDETGGRVNRLIAEGEQLARDLDDQRTKTADLETRLAATGTQRDDAREKLSAREAETSRLRKTIDAKEIDLTAAHARIQELEPLPSRLHTLETQIEERDNRIHQLEPLTDQIRERDRKIALLEPLTDQIRDRDRKITLLEPLTGQVRERDREITQRDQRIRELEGRLGTLSELRERLEAREKHIVQLEYTHRTTVHRMEADYRSFVGQKDGELARLRARIAELEQLSRTPAPSVPATPTPSPIRSFASPPATPSERNLQDDLKRIYGIGPKLEGLLHKLGYATFKEISEWTEADIVKVDEKLENFQGRIARDNWVAQATKFYQEKTAR